MKRIAIFIILCLAATGLIWWLVHILTTGHITITTKNPNTTITLTRVTANDDGNSSKPFTKQAHGKLSLTLGTGKYIATAQNNSVATTQTITLKPTQNLTITLNPPTASGIEPVAFVRAFNMVASSSSLTYINPDNNSLSQINNQNTITDLAPGTSLQGVHWANPSYGIAEDTSGQLYVVDNNSVKPLKNSLPPGVSSVNDYAVAPDKQVFLAVGPTIYTGTPGSGFKKLYTDNNPYSSLLASDNGVTVVNSPVDGPTDTGSAYAVVITNAGKATKKNVNIPATSAWSPDGKHLATVDEDDGLGVYNSSLENTVTIPGNNMGDVIWLDNQTLAYTTNDQLWTYSLSSGRANLLANTPLGGSATELTLSSDQAYIYVVVQNNDNYSVRRVGLHNQTVSPIVYQLQDILPETLNEYSLSLINFSHPTVIVQSTPTSPPSYFQDAQTQLQQNGFNLSQIEVREGVVNQSE